MKIFVTGPDTADSFTHNVAHTFRAMGHAVVTDPTEAFPMLRSAAGRGLEEIVSLVSARWRRRRGKRALRIAEEARPDLTVMCTLTFDPETVRRLHRASGGRVVCWYGDSAANLRRDHLLSGEYDAVFAKDEQLVGVLRSMLGIEAHHLPEACNPDWHRPLAECRSTAVVVAGTCYGYRNAIVGRLLEAGVNVRVYGPAPAAWVPGPVRAAHSGVFLDHTTKAGIFGEALACLGTFALSEGVHNVNCRIFETCACGGLLLAEDRAALTRYFDPGSEYLAYRSFEECLEHLGRLRDDYSAARVIRARAVKRAHGEHTYRHRLERMLAVLELA